MTATAIVIVILTIVQLVLCHFSFWWFLSLVARLLFLLRFMGVLLKTKYTFIMEGISIAIMLIWRSIYHSQGWQLKNMLITVIITAICVLTVVIDDINYVYVIEEDE